MGATMRKYVVLTVVATLTGAVPPAFPHHSFPVHFVPGKLITVEGVVTDFSFRNPHGLLHFTVTDAAGAGVEWKAETNSPNILRRRGWLRSAYVRPPATALDPETLKELDEVLSAVTGAL